MSQLNEELVILNEKVLKASTVLIAKNQILLQGYNDMLSLLLDNGNISKAELVQIIQSTLKKHNEHDNNPIT